MSDHSLLILIVVLLLVQQKGGWDAFLKDLWKTAWSLTILVYIAAFFGLGGLFITTKHPGWHLTLLFGIVALPMLVWLWREEAKERAAKRTPENIAREAEERARMIARVKRRRQIVAAWMRGRVAFFLAWTLGLALLGLFVVLCANAPTEVLWRVAGCVAMVVLVCVTIGGLAATANKAIQWALRRGATDSRR
jgi:hypothetical protein